MISASHARKIAPTRGIHPNDAALRVLVEEANLTIADAARRNQTSVEFFCLNPLFNADNPLVIIMALVEYAKERGFEVEFLAPHLLRFKWGKHGMDEPMSLKRIHRAVGPPPESPQVPSPLPIRAPPSAPPLTKPNYDSAYRLHKSIVEPPPLPPKMREAQKEEERRKEKYATASKEFSTPSGSARKRRTRVRIVAPEP
jgi:hypothetical protein